MKALAFSLISVSFMSLVLTACGSKDDDDDEAASTATSTYTYANTESIIKDKCATSGCHNLGSVNGSLASLADIKTVGASKILTRVQATDSSVMPQNDQDFKTSTNGKILIDWLKGGADLK